MIRGKNVSLRLVEEQDLPLLLEMINALDKRGAFSNTRLASAHKYRKDFLETGFSGDALERLLIVDKRGEVIGVISHFTTRTYTSARELGYIIYKKAARRKGYGTEAVRLLTDHIFENYQVNRIEISMATENMASEKLARKCGFTKEGTQRGALFLKGQYHDMHNYAMIRKDWSKLRAEIPRLKAA